MMVKQNLSSVLVKSCRLSLMSLMLTIPLTSFAVDTNLGTMLFNLQQSLGGIWTMLMASCWMLGVITFTLGMLKLKKFGQMTVFMSTHAEIVGPIVRIIIGTLLLYTPFSINIVLSSLWGQGAGQLGEPGQEGTMQGYKMIAESDTSAQALMFPVFSMVQVIGLVAFIRGMMKMTKVGEQGTQGNIQSGLMLVFGGVMAINIVATTNAVRATFGIGEMSFSLIYVLLTT
jgi:intracellular multiplication protein IcmC